MFAYKLFRCRDIIPIRFNTSNKYPTLSYSCINIMHKDVKCHKLKKRTKRVTLIDISYLFKPTHVVLTKFLILRLLKSFIIEGVACF